MFAAELLDTGPDDLVLDYACINCGRSGLIDHGRPGYRKRRGRTAVRVSLSRSGAWCLLAGSTGSEVTAVGVDLEYTDRVTFPGFDDLVLTAAERNSLVGVGEPEAGRMRARLWTRKEAFLKVIGTGVFRDPSTVDVSAQCAEGAELIDIDPRVLGLPAGLTAAAAIRRSA
jgi:4'-phosphopantetheinyl transferase